MHLQPGSARLWYQSYLFTVCVLCLVFSFFVSEATLYPFVAFLFSGWIVILVDLWLSRADRGEKLIWTVVLILLNGLIFPVYWFIYLRNGRFSFLLDRLSRRDKDGGDWPERESAHLDRGESQNSNLPLWHREFARLMSKFECWPLPHGCLAEAWSDGWAAAIALKPCVPPSRPNQPTKPSPSSEEISPHQQPGKPRQRFGMDLSRFQRRKQSPSPHWTRPIDNPNWRQTTSRSRSALKDWPPKTRNPADTQRTSPKRLVRQAVVIPYATDLLAFGWTKPKNATLNISWSNWAWRRSRRWYNPDKNLPKNPVAT